MTLEDCKCKKSKLKKFKIQNGYFFAKELIKVICIYVIHKKYMNSKIFNGVSSIWIRACKIETWVFQNKLGSLRQTEKIFRSVLGTIKKCIWYKKSTLNN